MLFKVGVKGAAGITAALVFLGASIDWTPVKAVPVTKQDTVAQMCAKIDASTYGYCCKLRLEQNCPAAGKITVRQSLPVNPALRPGGTSKPILLKLAQDVAGEEDINADSNSMCLNS